MAKRSKKDCYVRRWSIHGETDDYTLAIKRDSGLFTCNCPNWIFVRRKQGKNCKHIDMMLETLENAWRQIQGRTPAADPVQYENRFIGLELTGISAMCEGERFQIRDISPQVANRFTSL